ncbi:MAG: Ig-like domain-containing protein, partial [Acidimicrobiia bacterium]
MYFNLYLPSGSAPPAGWPVVILGATGSSDKEVGTLRSVATMAERGIATIAINPPGHGLGPLGTLIVNRSTGPVTLPSGGRGRDVSGDHVIRAGEGYNADDRRILGRDGAQQAAADLVQLVRIIQLGVDIDGDTIPDLDPSRIYYHGRSNAGGFGTLFMAIEPDVRVGIIAVAGGSVRDVGTWSPVQRFGGQHLEATGRSYLINPPGITHLDGVLVTTPPHVDENRPLRNGVPYVARLQDGTTRTISSPTINTVAGALAIQEVWERFEWIQMAGDPLGYASHLRKDPLAGVPAKTMLLQIAKGDPNVPNPTNTALIRAGDLADRTTYYRHDLAFAESPAVGKNPHGFAGWLIFPDPIMAAIGFGSQRQLATFLASDGAI